MQTVGSCSGFSWEAEVNFLHSSLYDAVVWICYLDIVSKPEFWLLSSSACTASELFLFPTLSVPTGILEKAGRGHSWNI